MEAYWHWFCRELYLDRSWGRILLTDYGTPREIFQVKEEELKKRYPEKYVRHLDMIKRRATVKPEWEYETCLENGVQFFSMEHSLFPASLREIPDCPLGIYVKGKLPSGKQPSVAVVGARMCSDYGKMTAGIFARGFARMGVQIISGMAYGIDGQAQRSALIEQGKSYAVLGCGVDICYPRQNRDLYEQLIQKGGVISECPPGTPPLPRLFPMRNRIISGLSGAVVIVEAKERSGSLITADAALEQGKEVFAVPGRIGDILSSGCNRLIAQGAGIAISPEYVCKELGIFTDKNEEKEKFKKNLLESAENIVYSCLSLQSQHIEEIRKKTGLPLLEVMRILVSLELKGWVHETQKNYYSKTSSG